MRLAAEKLACAWAAYELSCVNHSASAGEHLSRRPLGLNALEHGIVHAHVVGFCADDLFFAGVENYQVSVGANRDGSFAGIETEQFCGCGGDEFDEAIGGEALSVDTAGVDEA